MPDTTTPQIHRYAACSLVATVVDFGLYQSALWAAWSVFWATALGVAVSGVVAWWLNRRWVFTASDAPSAGRFAVGVGLGLLLNSFGTAYLVYLLPKHFWLARVVTALAVWRILYGFNQRFVFHQVKKS